MAQSRGQMISTGNAGLIIKTAKSPWPAAIIFGANACTPRWDSLENLSNYDPIELIGRKIYP
jgi:hypothetical protein